VLRAVGRRPRALLGKKWPARMPEEWLFAMATVAVTMTR
jgi:hypothetical protein